MKRLFAIVLLTAVVSQAAGIVRTGDSANVFMLKRSADGVVIERLEIPAGTTQVVSVSDEMIDLIFPPSPGRSASLVEPGSVAMYVIRNTGEEITVEVRSADGSKRALPSRSIADLKACNIRVSITGGGFRSAFLIERDEQTRTDVGPVSNMFAGQLPEAMLKDAFVVQTDTYHADAGAPIQGVVPLTIDRWPFVRVALPNGTETDFLVDVGAGETVMDRRLLPDGIEIEETKMVEYSAQGKRLLNYEPGGATGKVTTVAGHALLDRLTLGDVTVDDVTVTVMESMPDMFGRPVGGILGIDVLRRCGRLTLTLAGEAPSLSFDWPAEANDASATVVPFALVGSHVMVESLVNGVPAHFIVDTGAPSSFLDESAAAACGVEADHAREQTGRGLDEGSVVHAPGIISNLQLGGGPNHADVPCRIAALAAFETLRGPNQHVGLLGNDFLSRFKRIEIDFGRWAMTFVK